MCWKPARRFGGTILALSLTAAFVVTAGADPAQAAFPGGNGIIAYERGGQIWLMNADGSGARGLVSGATDPAWSADGTKLAFAVNGDIYVWDFSGTLFAMTNTPTATESYPAWSPDGKQIAYERGGSIWVLNTTGLPNAQIWVTEVFASYRQPDWSPDGTTILAVREPVGPGDQEIYAIDAAAPWNRTNLTNTASANEHHPTWAPGGQRIAYIRDADLWVMAKNGGGQTAVTGLFPGSAHDPSWSPDGSLIAVQFNAGLGVSRDIYTVADQSWAGNFITSTPELEENPAWAPRYPPRTVPDAVTVAEGGTVAGNVLFNDQDAFQTTRTVEKVADPAHGSVTITAAGAFTYTHDGSETTTDAFTYKVFNGSIYSKVETATVTVTPVNDPPVAVNDSYTVARGGVLTVNGVLDNDTDVDNTVLTAVKVTDPAHGTLTLAANGSFTYVHDGSAVTQDSFTYRANDGAADSNVATASIAITAAKASSVGLVDPAQGTWHLRDYASGAVNSFTYGNPGDTPFLGDWNCDGTETPGLFRVSDAFAYLRNSNTTGIADIRFFFGNPSDVPLAGDFDGDGCDTLSLYRPSEQRFYIVNKLGANNGGLGPADFSFVFGDPGDKPVVGDWDGDGVDEVGLHREGTGFFYYRTTLDTGAAHAQFFFGDPADRFVAGDWGVVDTMETPAVFRPSNTTFYFRHTNSPGPADSQFVWGDPGWLPVGGTFG